MGDEKQNLWLKIISIFAIGDFFPFLFLYIVLIAATVPFGSSLWLDETVSVWISQAGSFEAVTKNALYFQGQSPLYFLLLSLMQKFTVDYSYLRIASFIILLLSARVLYAVVFRLSSERVSAVVAVLCYLTMDRVLANGVSLRPYSLGLLFCFLSLYCLLRSRELSRAYVWRLLHILSFSLAMYCHYFFAALLIVHVVLVLQRPIKGESSALVEFVINHVIAFLTLIPAVRHLQDLAARSSDLTIASSPTLYSIGQSLFPIATTVSVVLSVALALVFFFPRVKVALKGQRQAWVVGLVWWAVAPLAFAALALGGWMNVFLERYYLWTAGGFCLVAGLFLSSFRPIPARNTAIAVLCIVFAIRTGARQWQIEDWREVALILEQEASNERTAVLAYTGLIEAENPLWLRKHPRYLVAPLIVYGLSQEILPLPSRFHTKEVRGYLEDDVRRFLSGAPEAFILISRKMVLEDSGELKEVTSDLVQKIAALESFQVETRYESSTLVLVRLHSASPRPTGEAASGPPAGA